VVALQRHPSTKDQILRAARHILHRDGVAALTIRAVAAEAGVNLALVHYHFHSRDGLLLAVLEDLNTELLTRQRSLYDQSHTSLADKWRQAIDYYRCDLDSGYVRILLELAAHGYANAQMAERVRAAMRGWQDLLHDVIAELLERQGIDLISADELTSVLASFWYGMELRHLLGVAESEGHMWRTLETIGRLIEQLEGGAEKAASVRAEHVEGPFRRPLEGGESSPQPHRALIDTHLGAHPRSMGDRADR
jgi:AcrR family transcriptional regulator